MKSPPTKRELTVPFIKAARSDSAISLVWDTRQPGLALRLHRSGLASFVAIYRHAGKNRWYTIGPTTRIGLSDARVVTRNVLARAVLGQDPQGEKRAARFAAKAGDTLLDVCVRYVSQVAKRQKAWKQGDLMRRRYLLPPLGHKRLDQIMRVDIERIFDELTAQGLAATANQVIAHTSSVFSWAVSKGLMPVNVAAGIKQNPTQARRRIIESEEMAPFWNALDNIEDTSARALKVLLLSGQRPGEVRSMRQRDLRIGDHVFEQHRGDGRVNRVTVRGAWWTLPGEAGEGWPGTKNSRTHTVWLPKAALDLIEPLLDGKSAHVFRRPNGGRIAELAEPMRRVCQILGWAGAKRMTAHDLRRTHGTTITGLGFGRDAMNRVQNHVEGGIADVYDQSRYEDESRRVMEAVAARLLTLGERHIRTDNIVELHGFQA